MYKVTVTRGELVNTANGPISPIVTFEGVETYELKDGVLKLTMESAQEVFVNWARCLSIEVDPFGSIEKIPRITPP